MSRTVIEGDIDVRRLRPLGDRVLVRVIERTETSAGLWIKTPATPCKMGEVLAMGFGIVDRVDGRVYPLELSPGQIVLFMDYAQDGAQMELRGGKYAVIQSNGLWATVKLANESSYDIATISARMDMLVVEPYDEARTKGGIHLPLGQDVESGLRRAKVISVGPGMWKTGTGRRDPVAVHPGDWIVMTRFAGADIMVNGKELRIINESDVSAGWED